MAARRLFTVWCTTVILIAPPTALAATQGDDRAGPRPPNGAAKRIERFAPYQPQTNCRPKAKAGTKRFARRMLRFYGQGKHIAISKPCGSGTSEHYEGRAWDWGLNAHKAVHRKTAHHFLHWLLKQDKSGRAAANARRLGVMYVIWNRRIWSSYRHKEGWNRYPGSNPHTDHIHVSLTRRGGRGLTSYWTGKVS